MPESAGTLFVEIDADLNPIGAAFEKLSVEASKVGSNLKSSFDKASKSTEAMQKKLEKVSSKLNKVGKAMTTYVTLPILAAGAAAIKFGSDYEESLNKVNVAFGKSADSVVEWSNTTLTSIGLARGTALDMAAGIGDMATSMGFATDQAAEMGKELVNRAADLASFKNISIEVANTALKGVFTGETESLKTLGVVMTQANLQAYALSQGITTNIKDMTEAEKVSLRYSFVLAKTGNAAGDFARTSDGAANQMRIFRESLKELSQSFGQIILPAFTKIVMKVNEVIQWFGNLSDRTKRMIVIFLATAAAIGPILIGISKLVAAIKVLLPVIKLLMSTGQVGLIIAAIAALIVALTLLIRNWDVVSAKMKVFWESFKFYALQAFKIVGAGIIKFAELFLKGFEIINKPVFLVMNKMIQAFNKISGKNIPTLSAAFSTATTALNQKSKEMIADFKATAAAHKKAVEDEKRQEEARAQAIAAYRKGETDKNVKDLEFVTNKTKEEFKKRNKIVSTSLDEYAELIKRNEEALMTNRQLENQRYNEQLQNLKNNINQGIVTEKEGYVLKQELEKEHHRKMNEIRKQGLQEALSISSDIIGQVSSIYSQYYTNKGLELDNEQAKEIKDVEKSAMTEEQKQAAIEKINAKYDKKRRKLQYEQAKQEKKLKIFNAVISTAQAVTNALGQLPFPANIALASLMGALGAVQIDLIRKEPLPELAQGGLTQSATRAIIGEDGQEAVIPLEKPGALAKIANALAPVIAARLAPPAAQGSVSPIGGNGFSGLQEVKMYSIEDFFTFMYQATKDGRFFVSQNGVVS